VRGDRGVYKGGQGSGPRGPREEHRWGGEGVRIWPENCGWSRGEGKNAGGGKKADGRLRVGLLCLIATVHMQRGGGQRLLCTGRGEDECGVDGAVLWGREHRQGGCWDTLWMLCVGIGIAIG
jgi:hypothetical protein